MKKIEVLITPEGDVQVKPIGYKGSECKTRTMSLENALGVVTSDEVTSEMMEQEIYTNAEARNGY